MAQDDSGKNGPGAGQAGPKLSPAQAAREARLAQALRENLRRRKAQARGRRAADKPEG